MEKKPQDPIQPSVTPPAPVPIETPSTPSVISRKFMLTTVALMLLAGFGTTAALAFWPHPAKVASTTERSTPTASPVVTASPVHSYGDKYASGILPVGDNHYTTAGARTGYIYLCSTKNLVPAGQAGAQSRGPWFVGSTQWDSTKKAHVSGGVNWTPQLSVQIVGGKRVITTNDLPNHPTGVFPISSGDQAYRYDRNPNSITSQTLTYDLDAAPTPGAPSCMGGEVGVMNSGVALFNGFDAGGRDAGAWEVQDGCSGHPERTGEYHYHTLSSCIATANADTVIGWALDGFPITGPKVADHNIITTSDLDECHGMTSEIILDGKKVTTYHYVMTQDFPYSVSCFRGHAIAPPHSH